MTEQDAVERAKRDAIEQIRALVKERRERGPNRLREALAIASAAGVEEGWIIKGFEDAEQALNDDAEVWISDVSGKDVEAEAFFKNPEPQPKVEKPKAKEVGLQAQFKPREAREREAAKPQKIDVRKYDWSEVVIPESAGDIEALTYVPGLVGQIVDWIVSGARRPNRVMALGVALGVVGTLIGRRFEGPTGSATHLYVFILARTGWGKDHPLWCGNKLMVALGCSKLLGPSEFVSGRGIIKYLKREPLVISFADELGDMFQLINNQNNNQWVNDIMGHLKRLYNSWELFKTAESVRDESVVINHPAFTIVGACTPQAFFEVLTPRDVEGGFANRVMLLPFEGLKRAPERDVPEGAEEPPKELLAELALLVPPASDPYSQKVSEIDVAPPVEKQDRVIISWENAAAKAEYFKFSQEIDGFEETDKRRFELGMRATENAARCATIIAAGCFSKTVNEGDIGWALRWSRVSLEASYGGIAKYMREYYEFPKFCERVTEFIREQGGFAASRDLDRKFRSNMKYGHELEKALAQLQKEGIIERASRPSRSGPAAQGWRLKDA